MQPAEMQLHFPYVNIKIFHNNFKSINDDIISKNYNNSAEAQIFSYLRPKTINERKQKRKKNNKKLNLFIKCFIILRIFVVVCFQKLRIFQDRLVRGVLIDFVPLCSCHKSCNIK